MKHKLTVSLTMIIMILGMAACQAETEPIAEPTSEPTVTGLIVLGDVSDDPIEKIENFQPLADYLAANLNEYGIGVGEVKIAPDLETMGAWLKSGEVDIYFDSAYPTVVIGEMSGAHPILRRWKEGSAEYSSVIVVRADSGLNTPKDLNGHLFGFEDPQSTSGYFMPLSFLLDNGLNVVEKEAATSPVAADEVGYVFTGDENTAEWVFSGKVAATAMKSGDFEELPEDVKSELSMLAETELMPRHLVIVRPGLDADVESAIYDLLVGIDETAEGAEILLQFEETAQFDEIPLSASDFLDKIRALYLQFQEE